MEFLGTPVKDAAIGWVVQSILKSLFTENMKAWSREVDLDGDVEKLKSAMLFVNTVVDAARGRKLQNEGLCLTLLDLKQLLYDAEDVMDELDYYRLQREIEGGDGDGSVYSWSSSTLSSVAWNAAKKIVDMVLPSHRKRKREDDTLLAPESKREVSQRINKIANQLPTAGDNVRRALKLEISPTNAMPYQSLGEPRRNTRLTTSMQVEPKVYGREEERNEVVELLINEKYSDLGVLPIVGGGGVGKTTLSRFVCDDQRIRSHFDLQMWVCVSTVFDRVRLTREMLEHVCKDGKDFGKISSFNVLQDTLLENIRNKRFLLVLDDIWEDKDKIGWDNLLAPLKRNHVPGCMILATTRSKSVAKMIGTMDVVEMKGLDEKEFWLLFKACAFGNENCTDHPTLHTIGQQIAKTLKGYPLAAQSVGALLKENLSYEHWQDVQETWKSRQENDGDILPILELSYDYLPSHLQRCFSYCSLFPEDHRFNGETLVRAWISQNFVQSKDTSKRLEETGMQYLYRLVDLGFFQKVGSQYVMHDLMHELAEKVSSNECATINGSESENIQPSVRHLSIITTAYDKDEHCNFPSEKFENIVNILRNIGSLKKLRTLMFFGLSSINLLRSLHTLCNESKSLRFLRIYVTGANVSSTHNLLKPYHLRYLELFCVSTNISTYVDYENTAFPQALTKFYHLQTLHLENCREWRILGSLEMLPLLTKLTLVRMWNLTEVSIPSLEELVFVKMPKLEKCIGTAGLELTSRLRVLMVKDCPKLNEFTLSSFQAEQKSRFTSLTKLTIGRCPHIIKREILPLEEMRALKELELMDVHGVRVLSVPSLEKLVLIKMPSLESCSGLTASPPQQFSPSQGEQKEWVSSLRTLTICDCPNLIVSHPLPPSALISELSIKGVPTFPTMKMSWRRLTIESNELSVLDDKVLAFHNLRGITSLIIQNCPNLVSLPSECFNQLTTLQTLHIANCPNLLKSHVMSESAQEDITSANSLVLPSLKSLFISSCGIAGRCLTQMLLHLLSLEELTLSGCPQIKLVSISQPTEAEETDRLASAATVVASSAQDELVLKMPSNLLSSLKRLCIYNFRDLEICGGNVGFGGFTSLEKLLLGETKDDGTVDETLLPPSLQELSISRLPANMHSYFPKGLKKLFLYFNPYLKCAQPWRSCKSGCVGGLAVPQLPSKLGD